jgi:putative peptide maturation system protein
MALMPVPDAALAAPDPGAADPSASGCGGKSVLRVNGRTLDLARDLTCLSLPWEEAALRARLVDACLLQAAIAERGIEVSEPDLQQAMDTFRREHDLYSAAETHRWLEQHGLTHARLEAHVAGQAAVTRLRDRIAEGRIGDYFYEHPADFDTAHVARFTVLHAERAHRLAAEIRSGEIDFFTAAQQEFLDRSGADGGDLFAVVRRGQLAPEQSQALFSASPGEVVGPVGPLPRAGGWEIIRVLQIHRARLQESTRAAIREILFQEWLAGQRAEATLEWL